MMVKNIENIKPVEIEKEIIKIKNNNENNINHLSHNYSCVNNDNIVEELDLTITEDDDFFNNEILTEEKVQTAIDDNFNKNRELTNNINEQIRVNINERLNQIIGNDRGGI